MSDFTQIGALVKAGTDLLNSIKGGAILTMQTQFDALKNTISAEWNSIKTQLNNDVSASIARIDTETVINKMGFVAMNYNGDFLDTKVITNSLNEPNTWPLRMGMGPGRNDAVRTEIIPVRSGSDPLTRDPEVKSLLDYMGIGANRDHFSANFNILKMTVVDATRLGTGGVDFFMPDQHVKLSPAMTYMHYFKTVGSVNVNLGGNSNGAWSRYTNHTNTNNPGEYWHVDLLLSGATDGDVVYFALPTVCPGHFPNSAKLGQLYNPNNSLIRKIEALHQPEPSQGA